MDAPSRPDDDEKARPGSALVLAGGEPVDARVAGMLPPVELVVAADSGLAQARRLGLRPDLLVGDLDSVDAGEVAAVAEAGTRIERHPAEKDAIDLELALDAACDAGAATIVLVAGAAGRLDMALANLLVIARPKYTRLHIEGWIGTAWIGVARPDRRVEIRGTPGELVSLLPLGGAAGGITTEGLRYPLRAEALDSGTTRGVSNELLDAHAAVSLTRGVLLIVRPDALEAP